MVTTLRARIAGGLATSTLIVAVLAGCSSSGGTTTAQSVGPAVNPSIAPTHAQRAIPADRDIVEVPALRKTVKMTGCSAVDGGWAGTGTVANPAAARKTYHLLVFFTDKYARTIDYARTTVSVSGGKNADWTASAKFDAPSGTKCVLRGLYQS